jgi:hypothetical protein
MKPFRLGLIAAVALGMLAPAAVYSQAKTASVSEKDRQRGMAEAPALAPSRARHIPHAGVRGNRIDAGGRQA